MKVVPVYSKIKTRKIIDKLLLFNRLPITIEQISEIPQFQEFEQHAKQSRLYEHSKTILKQNYTNFIGMMYEYFKYKNTTFTFRNSKSIVLTFKELNERQ